MRMSKVKKRRGVGSRVIAILDSDEDSPPPKASNDFARIMKTRVSASAKAEKVSMSSVPIFEEEQLNTPAPVEANVDDSADVVIKNVVPAVPAKRRKRANDSVHFLFYQLSVLLTVLQTKMRTFLGLQYTLLDDIVSLDGLGDRRPDLCSSCSKPQSGPLYRCLECAYSLLHCGECIINLHKVQPLHRLEVRLSFECATNHQTHITPSAGRMGSSTGHPSIRSDSFATSGTGVICAP